MKIAVAVTTYRRPYYTKILADSLTGCKYPIYVSQDWDNHHSYECAQVSAILEPSWVHNPKQGIDLNKIFILDQLLVHRDYDAVIFLEDDTIPYDLDWFEQQLDQYKDDPKFLAACGYNRQTASSSEEWCAEYKGRLDETWRSTFNPWGWAMHRHTYHSLYADNGAQYKADTGSEANGRFDWWLSSRPDMFCIRPVVARTQSIGWMDAEHTPSRDFHMENEYNQWGCWTLKGLRPEYKL